MNPRDRLTRYDPGRENLNTGIYQPRRSRRTFLRVAAAIGISFGLVSAEEAIRRGIQFWQYENPQSQQIHDARVTFVNEFPTLPTDSLQGQIGLLKNFTNPVILDAETIYTRNTHINNDLGITPAPGEITELVAASYQGLVTNEAGIPREARVDELSNILLLNREEYKNQTGRAVSGWEDDAHHANMISELKSATDQKVFSVVGFWIYGPIVNGVSGATTNGWRFIATRFPTSSERKQYKIA